MVKKSLQKRKYQTQWTSQFYVAAELTRRGYLVSLTLGNAPISDLLVQSSKGVLFTVDVKGQSTKNFWLIQRREPSSDHYFIFVYLPKDGSPPEFFVASSKEVMRRREEYKKEMETKGRYRDDLGGIRWSTVLTYRNRWDTLPK